MNKDREHKKDEYHDAQSKGGKGGKDDMYSQGFQGGKGAKGDNAFQGYGSDKDIERITIDFLLFPAVHLPHYNNLDNLLGLIGNEYAPIKKLFFYFCISWKYRTSIIRVGKIQTDARIHGMLRQLTGTGKQNIINATVKLASKCGLTYGMPTSLHPEQLIGKVIRNKDGFENVEGYFDRDIVILNEDKNYIQSEDLKYSEIRSYIRIAKDSYPDNRIEKNAVDIPTAEALKKNPYCVILQFGQPVTIPEARVDDGDIGRDIIPFVDFEGLDQSDIMEKRVLEDYDGDPEESIKEFSVFWDKLPIVPEFVMAEEARPKFAEFSKLLYKYGMQYSVRVARYMQKKKTRIQNSFLKFTAIQAACKRRDTITIENVEKAFIDYFEMLTLEFDMIEKWLKPDVEKIWRGAKTEDRACLEWLVEQGATSFDESDVTISEYRDKIREFCKLSESGARHRHKRHKENHWIYSKQVGKHNSKVWLLFTPKINRITSKEFVTKTYKTYRDLIAKYFGEYPTQHDTPYTPYTPQENNPDGSSIPSTERASGISENEHPMNTLKNRKCMCGVADSADSQKDYWEREIQVQDVSNVHFSKKRSMGISKKGQHIRTCGYDLPLGSGLHSCDLCDKKTSDIQRVEVKWRGIWYETKLCSECIKETKKDEKFWDQFLLGHDIHS